MSSQPAMFRGRCLLLSVCLIACAVLDLCVASVRAQLPGGSASANANESLRQNIKIALDKVQEGIAALEDGSLSETEQTTLVTESNRLIRQVLEADAFNARAKFLRGRLSILAGRQREALADIEAYLRDDQGKNDWLAHKLVGDLYVVSYPKLATAEYRQAIELAAEEPDAHIGLAEAYLKLDDPDAAIASARTALRYDRKETARYRDVLARGFLAKTDGAADAVRSAREAVKIMEKKVRESPGEVPLLEELRGYYYLLNDCQAKIVELYPEQAEHAVDRARTWQDLADLNRLIDYSNIRTFIQKQRNNPRLAASPALMLEEARLNWMLGATEQAVELLNQILEIDANNQPARELLDKIQPPAVEAPGATAPHVVKSLSAAAATDGVEPSSAP